MNKKSHAIHSHDVYVLFGEMGNKASKQLLNIYLFLISGTLYDSNTKRCSEKPPTLTASYLVPSSFFCIHQEITYAYTTKYTPQSYKWRYSTHFVLHLGFFSLNNIS